LSANVVTVIAASKFRASKDWYWGRVGAFRRLVLLLCRRISWSHCKV